MVYLVSWLKLLEAITKAKEWRELGPELLSHCNVATTLLDGHKFTYY